MNRLFYKREFFSTGVLILMLLSPSVSNAAILRSLKVGDSGNDVRELQIALNQDADTRIANEGAGSPGNESNYFGQLTKRAVMRFQEKYRSEVLSPVGLSAANGYVGLMTRTKLTLLAVTPATSVVSATKVSSYLPQEPSTLLTSSAPVLPDTTPTTSPATTSKPIIIAVLPDHVRRGDMVTITGRNFTKTGNHVELGTGPALGIFENISSSDGITLQFVYEPPKIETMNKEQILSLPYGTLQQILQPIEKAGGSIDDIINPYRNIQSEAKMLEILTQNGQSSDDMYYSLYVTVKNAYGTVQSDVPMLRGYRDFPFNRVSAITLKSLLADMRIGAAKLFGRLVPTVYAINGGGTLTGTVMICTCNGSTISSWMDITGGGTGVYVIPATFKPLAGTCRTPGFWLGGYTYGSQCTMYVGYTCTTVMSGNQPSNPVGCSS